MEDVHDAERIKSSVIAMLLPSKRPWEVIVSKSPNSGGWVVDMHHEASHGLAVDMGYADADETIATVAEMLGNRRAELDRVAAAPLLSHAETVMEIRALASMFNWSKFEVAAVVRFVDRWALSSDEAEWLISAIGHDGPKPASSWDF